MEEIYKKIDTLTRVLKMYNEKETLGMISHYNMNLAEKDLNSLLESVVK